MHAERAWIPRRAFQRSSAVFLTPISQNVSLGFLRVFIIYRSLHFCRKLVRRRKQLPWGNTGDCCCLCLFGFFFFREVYCGDPFVFYDCNVSYIEAAPLGVKQQVIGSVTDLLYCIIDLLHWVFVLSVIFCFCFWFVLYGLEVVGMLLLIGFQYWFIYSDNC